MTVRLADLHACFEGVIPSIIATAAADGTPNISYLSHVVMVDDGHIALSNQFFAKTSANVRANPFATLMLVDGRNGAQYMLAIEFVRSVEAGPLFERIALQLKASSAQVGMAGVMRLRSADMFRVHDIRPVASTASPDTDPPERATSSLAALARAAAKIEAETEAGGIIDVLLEGLGRELGYHHALVLLNEPVRAVLTTVGSIGYQAPGLGSEIHNADDLIATAAAHGKSIKVSDMSRIRRMGEAILKSSDDDENATRTIAFPHLPDAMSQLAVPMIVQGKVRGVVFIESRERMAFRDEDVAAIEVLARQVGAALALAEVEAYDAPAPDPAAPTPSARADIIRVTHHAFDDSIFIDNDYVIKGVAGRLLAWLIARYLAEGRNQFTNREIRLSESLRLPDLKDNLETRLLLLRRRLEQHGFPIRLIHSGRGKITLEIDGTPAIHTVE